MPEIMFPEGPTPPQDPNSPKAEHFYTVLFMASATGLCCTTGYINHLPESYEVAKNMLYISDFAFTLFFFLAATKSHLRRDG